MTERRSGQEHNPHPCPARRAGRLLCVRRHVLRNASSASASTRWADRLQIGLHGIERLKGTNLELHGAFSGTLPLASAIDMRKLLGSIPMPLNSNEADILNHLGYEWWMLKSMRSILLELPPLNDPEHNALIESMNIHVRSLVSFFCNKPKGNDWSVTHLGRSLRIVKRPEYLVDLLTNINKRIAHLTDTRASPFFEWHVEPAIEFIGGKVFEVRTALAKDFPTIWRGDAPETSIALRPLSSGVTGSSTRPAGGIGATGPASPGY